MRFFLDFKPIFVFIAMKNCQQTWRLVAKFNFSSLLLVCVKLCDVVTEF